MLVGKEIIRPGRGQTAAIYDGVTKATFGNVRNDRQRSPRDRSKDFFFHPVISAFRVGRYFRKLHILDNHPAGVASRYTNYSRWPFKPLN